jgi:hypothetical protein
MVIPMRAKGLTQALGPDAGGAVMATGIVSVAIRADGHETLSLALLALTATAWALLGGTTGQWDQRCAAHRRLPGYRAAAPRSAGPWDR